MRSTARVLLGILLFLGSLPPPSIVQGGQEIDQDAPARSDPVTDSSESVNPPVDTTTPPVEHFDPDIELAPAAELPEPGRRQVGYLNGRFVILNMHGMLFHREIDNIHENLEYATWLRAGLIRVFATDAGELVEWDGERVGNRIADIAPALRAANLKLIVAIVNNHKEVPGEHPESTGWMDGYYQLLLPFYTDNWRGAYLTFLRQLIGTVRDRDAQDVVWAWELGNELHTPRDPKAVLRFINAAARETRALDPDARILAGTMGVNHLDPGVPDSPVARALYCHGPISAYTLHAYDWRSPDYWGDMPIHWDFEHIVNRPCPNGRRLPIIVEELGTSRELPGVYSADQEDRRFAQELNQLRMALSYDGVVGVGVWSAESMYVRDISRFDHRRGLTSYGSDNLGGGTCFRLPDGYPIGARCLLERVIQQLPKMT
jgi:hypothetical protein